MPQIVILLQQFDSYAKLAHYGLIPEYAPLTTSVTTLRPGYWETRLGNFDYRHVQPSFLYGYQRLEVSSGRFAFVATPEKALLDLIYLTPHAADSRYLNELRLQNTEQQLHLEVLQDFAKRSGHPKLVRAAHALAERIHQERGEFETV
ncbi:MAG: hypothetical protein HY741_15715 [Chloroflexi bacterium]|nr:hypothetical protein [Chloroflexota bacterium]